MKRNHTLISGFSLVEVALSLGIVSFVFLSLLGLMLVGLNTARDSEVETTLAQIATNVANDYNPDLVANGGASYEKRYAYNGALIAEEADSSVHFTASVVGTASPLSSKLHHLTIEITSVVKSDAKRAFQTSVVIP